MTIFEQKYEIEKEDTSSPEHYLWISVLTKAAHDALYSSDWRESKFAMEWFKSKNASFRKVCEYAGKNPEYVYQKMIKKIEKRESHIEAVRSGNKLYVKDTSEPVNGEKIFHSHYRKTATVSTLPHRKRGRPKKKHLTGNAYYKARRGNKNLRAMINGSKGGRPRLYIVS